MTLALARDEADTRQADVFLHAYLEPFLPFLSRPDVTELIVNKPGEVWLEQAGSPAMERADVPQVDDRLVRRLAEQVARITNQAISREMPLLAATLPGGERLQGQPSTGMAAHGVTLAGECGGVVVADRGFVLDDGDGLLHGRQSIARAEARTAARAACHN